MTDFRKAAVVPGLPRSREAKVSEALQHAEACSMRLDMIATGTVSDAMVCKAHIEEGARVIRLLIELNMALIENLSKGAR